MYNNSVQKEKMVCFCYGTHHPLVPRQPDKRLLRTHEVVRWVLFVYVVWVIEPVPLGEPVHQCPR